jgi:hypothetical protein
MDVAVRDRELRRGSGLDGGSAGDLDVHSAVSVGRELM